MKEKESASPSNQNNKLLILTLLAILLLVGVSFWAAKKAPVLPNVSDEGTAAITLWLWTGNSENGGLSSYFQKSTDLAIEILGTGFINEEGVFVPSDTLNQNLRGAVRVQVQNKGKAAKTNWFLEASIPTEPLFTFSSDAFRPLQKKERRIFLLEFNQVTAKDLGVIKVKVTSGDEEKNTKNNTDESVVNVTS